MGVVAERSVSEIGFRGVSKTFLPKRGGKPILALDAVTLEISSARLL